MTNHQKAIRQCGWKFPRFLTRLLCVCLALHALLISSCQAANWPRLGGPAATGVSDETGLARNWPANGPREPWAVDLSEGFAGAAVYQGQVFLLDRASNEHDVLRCWELETGKEIWNLPYDAPGTLPFNGSRNVPTVDDHFIFTVGPFGHFRCVDRQSHQLFWSKHLVEDFKIPGIDDGNAATNREEKLARTQLPMWGLTQAPLLYHDLVIVAPQTQKTGLLACEKATGKIRWQSPYVGRNWYCHVSPSLMNLCGVDQIIMIGQPSDPEKAPDDAPPAIISSIDPQTGKLLWQTNTPGPDKIPIPQPLQVGADRLFISAGYKLGCLMLQVSLTNQAWNTKLLFHNRTVCPHIHSPALYQNRIFLTSFRAQGARHTGLVCLDTEGQLVWETGPQLEFDSGAFLLADGMAFVMNGKSGELYLLELSESGPKVRARAKVLGAKGANVWAPLALSNGRLIVRDQYQLKCLDVRVSKGSKH